MAKHMIAAGKVKGTKAKPPQCDFCDSKKIVYEYPARGFDIPQYGIRSNGAWAACEACHTFIEARAWSALLKRSVDTYPLLKANAIPRNWIEDAVRFIHSAFRQARTGPAQEVV